MLPTLDIDALQAENGALLEFLYVCPVGLVQMDEAGVVQMINPTAAQLTLPLAREMLVENFFDLLQHHAPELRNLADGFASSRGPIVENHRIMVGEATPEGDPQVLACTLVKIEPGRLMAVLTDISRQVAQERRLRQAESWFSAILTGVNDFALLSLDERGRVSGSNPSVQRQTGYQDAEILGRTLNVFYFPEEAVQGYALEQVDLARRDGWHINEGWRRRKDGTRYWCQSLVSAVKEENGTVCGFSVVLRDVTERKVSGEELKRLLTTDHLTGVANRARFFEVAAAEEARWQRYERPLSAIMIDIDHFKRVNDTFGHAGGDVVLKEVAALCAMHLRSTDTLARLGGEEFVILLPSIDLEAAIMVAERLRRAIGTLAMTVEGQPVRVTASLGCAEMGGALDTVDRLVRAADEALYDAKNGGRDCVRTYSPVRAVA